ncbi:MAG: D-glycero-beta-D-manno-heptose-7-phosphate kinase [bacterium]
MMGKRDLKRLLEKFKSQRPMVVGDIIMDKYVWGEVSRISPEAPVPVVDVARENFTLGGAANVAANILSLGGKPSILGVIGEDADGDSLLKKMVEMGIGTAGVVAVPERPTTVKVRVMACPPDRRENHQQLVRIDYETRRQVEDDIINEILDVAEEGMDRADAVIVADYGKGVFANPLSRRIIDLALERGKIVAVDPNVSTPPERYGGATVITPNEMEAEAMARNVSYAARRTIEAYPEAGRKLLYGLDCRMVIVTQGPRGMTAYRRDGEPIHIPTFAQEVYDVSGAGDTVIGTLTLAMCAGAEVPQACFVANIAAGVVVGKVGTATVSPEEVMDRFAVLEHL